MEIKKRRYTLSGVWSTDTFDGLKAELRELLNNLADVENMPASSYRSGLFVGHDYSFEIDESLAIDDERIKKSRKRLSRNR